MTADIEVVSHSKLAVTVTSASSKFYANPSSTFRMSISRSLILNGFTATVTFPTKLDAHKQLTCTLKMAQAGWGISNSETTFTVEMQDTTAPTSAPVLASTSPSTKDRHVKYIKGLLDDVEATHEKDVKAALAKALYDYLTDEALDFVKNHKRFMTEVVKKAYELKTDAAHHTKMCYSIDRVLLALGQPLLEPAPAVPIVQPVAASSSSSDTADLALLTAIAKKYKCDSVLQNTKEHLGYWRWAANHGAYCGLSKAQGMEKYLTPRCEDTRRSQLLQDIFIKKGLEYSPVIMDMYSEWAKTYTPPRRVRGKPKPNRYTKMCAFIEENKSAFINL